MKELAVWISSCPGMEALGVGSAGKTRGAEGRPQAEEAQAL